MLPTPRPRDGRDGHRHLAAHCPDEESGRRHPGFRGVRRRHRALPKLILEPHPGRRGAGRPPERGHQTAVRSARIPHQGGEHRPAEGNPHLLLRRGRGALHFRMGPRFPAGVPENPLHHRGHPAGPGHRPHRDGHAQGPERHSQEPPHHRCHRLQIILQSA